MKKAVLLGVLSSLVVVAIVFLFIRGRGALTTRQRAKRAGQSARPAGIPNADWKDDASWEKTPEFRTLNNQLEEIAEAADARGGPTADEAEVVIDSMHSPHFEARRIGALIAGYAHFEPARSVLLPHVVRLLSDPVYNVRMFAAFSLGRMGDKSVIPSLKPLLKDPIPWVASAAQQAISRLQDQEETVPSKPDEK